MLEAIGAGVTPRIGSRDWKDVWLDSPEFQQAKQEIEIMKAEALKKPAPEKSNVSMCESQVSAFPFFSILIVLCVVDATPFLYQLKTVVMRNNLAIWRSPDYVFTRFFVHVFISLFVSSTLLQLQNSVRDLQYRVSSLVRPTFLSVIAHDRCGSRCSTRFSGCKCFSFLVLTVGS